MVKLIDDDNFVRVGRDLVDPVRGQRLHAREYVTPSLGTGAPHVQLAEGRVCQDLPIRSQRLLEDLLPVRDKQE